MREIFFLCLFLFSLMYQGVLISWGIRSTSKMPRIDGARDEMDCKSRKQ